MIIIRKVNNTTNQSTGNVAQFVLSLSILIQCTLSDNYYSFWDTKLSQQQSENECNIYGKHLASIHSTVQSQITNQLCQCDQCWIGLNITKNNYQWDDETTINQTAIVKNWCNDYPVDIDIESNIISFAYIYKTENCWKNTYNSSSKMCSICGPQMFDQTGNYFICNIFIPFIISIIGLIYSLYILYQLKQGLLRQIQKWIIKPPKSVKRTAILYSALMIILFIVAICYVSLLFDGWNTKGIIAPSSIINADYPKIYETAGVFLILMGFIIFVLIPLQHIHLLLRLKYALNDNFVTKTVIPSRCKHFYPFVISLIVVYWILPVIYVIVNSHMHYLNGSKITVKMIIIALWIMTDIIINLVLLYLYIKVLHKISQHSFISNIIDNPSNGVRSLSGDRSNYQYELTIEATRYTVLFGMSCVMNVVVTIFVMIISYVIIEHNYDDPIEEEKWRNIKNMIFMLALFIKEMISLQTIYLSFKFSHTKYKKCCNFCDKWMRNKCRRVIENQNRETLQQLELTESLLIYDNEESINQSRSSITTDDYLEQTEYETESHSNIAKMQNAEDNVDAVNLSIFAYN